MFHAIQIIAILLVAFAMAPALAHALEFPGKMRLNRDAYVTVQPIYYPGFTVAGGIGEAGGVIGVLVLLLLTPYGTVAFSLTLVALIALMAMQIVYWVFTHPVNRFWLTGTGTKLSKAGARFFALEPSAGATIHGTDEWSRFRNRWEYSHIARAVLALLSFISLLLAATS